MQAAASVLNAKPLRRDDGEHLLFDDLPQRLRPDDIEAWEEDPGQRRRQRMNDGMAVAKETYSSWYVKPEDRYTAFLTEAAERKQQHAVTRKKPERPTTAQRPSMSAVPTPSPPRVLLLQSGTTPCDAGLSSGSAGSPSLDHRWSRAGCGCSGRTPSPPRRWLARRFVATSTTAVPRTLHRLVARSRSRFGRLPITN
jgi:hypothetical protein